MREGIHPRYYENATVICACGNTWTTGATVEVIHTDVCSACHPFFTGEQRIVDTAGQVERFMRRIEAKEKRISEVRAQQEAYRRRKEEERKKLRRGELEE